MTAAGTQREVPWDLSFLRVGALVTAALTALAAPVAGLLGGWDDALAVLVGAAVVAAFFVVSGLVIAWAGRHGEAFTLPAALGSFLVKILVLALVLQSLPADGWVDRRTLAWTVVAGALLWSVVQQRWVWTRRLYYVTPPAPPA
jgi:asparagine N-glycosylation enzyme membrane subunit Stt3